MGVTVSERPTSHVTRRMNLSPRAPKGWRPSRRSDDVGYVGDGNFRRHVDIARGSLDELEAILELVETIGCVADGDLRELRKSRSNCARMVSGLLRRLR